MGLQKGQKVSSHFKPGVGGNPNGRPKGTKNKFTKQAKEYIKKAVGKHIKNLEKDIAMMSPAERVKALSALMKFVMYEKTQVKGEMKGDVKVTINYSNKKKADDNQKD